jgi:hypothetical protein
VTRNNGSGTLISDVEHTFTNCDIGRATLQGDPAIFLHGETTFQGGLRDTHTLHKTGALLFTPEGGVQGRAQFDCTLTWNRQSGTVSATGTVSWEHPVGTPVAGPGCGGQ